MLEPGDIFAVKGKGVTGWLSRNLAQPETDRFHYGIILEPCKDSEDYLILESISKGLSIGRLSFYDGEDLRFYRANCPANLRRRAPVELTMWGRSYYDYLLLPKLIIQGLWLLITKRRRIKPEELTWSQNGALLCTEAVDIAFDAVGVNLIPTGVCPIPSAFRKAELKGRMVEIARR